MAHHVADLGGGEIGAEAGAEILGTPRVAEHVVDPRPVGADETPRMVRTQERPALAGTFDLRLELVRREVAAWQRRAGSPCRPGDEKILDARQDGFGEPP